MITIALAGNPNCGKTTLFNSLTGSTAHVGNWPGVTVERRAGVYKDKKRIGDSIQVIDLPGIYSLSPYTPEEVISRNFILNEHPDVVINILDGTNLERNLYMTTQILEMDVPVVIAINMADAVKEAGETIDLALLEKTLGVPVVEISALHNKGLDELMERAREVAAKPRQGKTFLNLGKAVDLATDLYRSAEVASPLFHALKALEKDELELEEHAEIYKKIAEATSNDGVDYESAIADARYQFLTPLCDEAVTGKPKQEKMKFTKSDKIDRVLTNRWAAFPILILIMYVVFRIVFAENLFFVSGFESGYPGFIAIDFGWVDEFNQPVLYRPFEDLFWSTDGIHSPGVILAGVVEGVCGMITEGIRALMNNAGAVEWVQEFICDGVLSGVFAVLGFLPQILLLFLFFSILEDSGYMARVAFVLDRLFRKFGVSGRAFIPMIMGFGCGVPAMINTRTLASDKERTKTIRVIPFFTCGAKLPILIAITGAIIAATGVHPTVSTLLILGMYVLGFAAAVIAVIVMNKTSQREKVPPFIMELPSYHAPQFKALMIHVWDKAKHFIKKAFTIILVSTVIIWFMTQFTWDWKFIPTLTQEQILFTYGGTEINMSQYSILAGIGKLIQPLFTPLGWGVQVGDNGWVYSVAAVQGLVAKENVISTFGTLSTVISGVDMSWDEQGVQAIQQIVNVTMPNGADIGALVSFMAFNILTIPCFASVATAKGELQNKKLFWGTVAFWLVTSYVVASFLYLTIDFVWTLAISLPLLASGIVALVIYDKKKKAKGA